MSTSLVFCTSQQIDAQDLKALNEAYRQAQSADVGNAILYNALNPAHNNPVDMLPASKQPISDWNVQHFIGLSDEQLQSTFDDLLSRDNKHTIEPAAFMVLDERGKTDRTIQIHAKLAKFSDQDSDGYIEEDTSDAALEEYWRVWRVTWDSVWEMLTAFESTSALVDQVLAHSETHTDVYGVYNVHQHKMDSGWITT